MRRTSTVLVEAEVDQQWAGMELLGVRSKVSLVAQRSIARRLMCI